MNDEKKPLKAKSTLSINASKLTLAPKLGSGAALQSSDAAKSIVTRKKTVTVEVKKNKFLHKGRGSGQEAGGGDGRLTADELKARMQAVQASASKEQPKPMSKRPWLEEEQSVSQEIQQADETVQVIEAKVEKPTVEVAASVPDIEAALLASANNHHERHKDREHHKPADLLEEVEVEEKKAVKKEVKPVRGKGDEGRRQSSKININALSLVEEEQERVRSLASIKRARVKAKRHENNAPSEKIIREVILPETITVQELASRMAERGADVVRELMKLGVLANISQTIDADTAELVIMAMGHKVKRVQESDVENVISDIEDSTESMQPRPPVVTIMGHVDHGKTSLLDALRQTDVAAGEAGGITQHIGAYQVHLADGNIITFLDTPGHEAFTAMRARGAKATDIVVLVVAADDGIMAQTVEAINHAKAAEVPIIVAVNKIDKPQADVDRVKGELLQHELIPEDMGGDIMVVPVSAMKKLNLDKLLEAILLQAEMMQLKVSPDRSARGVVIESRLEAGHGNVASLLVQKGTLQVGDIVVAGTSYGKVRHMRSDHESKLLSAGPSMPVEIVGLNSTPDSGEMFAVVESDKQARDISEYRINKARQAKSVVSRKASTLEDLFAQQHGQSAKELRVVLKGDVQGSIEAIVASLQKFSHQEVSIKVLHAAVGGINESDVTLANASGAMIVGFNVRANAAAKRLAENEAIEIRYYSIIYDLIDEIKAALSGMLSPIQRQQYIGTAEIRQVFNITKVGKVAGCYVTEGLIKRGSKVRLLRDNIVIFEGDLKTLQRFKDNVKEVRQGFECGIALQNYEDIRVGDLVEASEVIEEKQQL